MAYVYIIYSQVLDKYYVGHTTSLPEERLKKHLQKHKGFTSTANDWKIAYIEAFAKKSDAYARERQIKSWKSKENIRALIEMSD